VRYSGNGAIFADSEVHGSEVLLPKFVRYSGNGAIFADSEVHGSEVHGFFRGCRAKIVRYSGNGAIFAESEVHGSEVHGFFFRIQILCAILGTAQFSRRLAIKVQTNL
jgi:hypothetical protein